MSDGEHDQRTKGGHLAPFVAPAWEIGERVLTPSGHPLVMGIVNLTPDSFYPDSRADSLASAVDKALAMVAAGADILDLGASSSRPGADTVGAQQEADRLLPVLTALTAATATPLSIDTFHAEVARQALDITSCVINDITGGGDRDMFDLVAQQKCGMVLMHMQGEPATMQDDPLYADPVAEIAAWLESRAQQAEKSGIHPERILVDPGLGFGKNLVHNLALLQQLPEATAHRPHLLGASRKGFIGEISGAKITDRLPGSLAALTSAWHAGTSVVRVHDVAETVQFFQVMRTIATAAI